MVRTVLSLIALFSLVVVSGCTSPFGGGGDAGATGTSQGLNVEYVQTSYKVTYSGETIGVEAKIQNLGDQNIEHVTAKPIYLPWAGFNYVQEAYDLARPNPEVGRQGGIHIFRWPAVTVAHVDKQETFPVGVRFYYDYSTETRAQVFAISATRYKGLQETGAPLPMAKTISNTNGPIRVDVLIDEVIIIPSSGSRKVPVSLKFQNTGTGYPQAYSDNARNFVIDSVMIDSQNTGGMYISDYGSCTGNIPMRGGSFGECVLFLEVPPSTTDEIIADLRITSTYTYAVEGKSQITVNPDLEEQLS
ncbi:MAG: hypothetical protein ACP5E4_01405 [Candidatus Aenigmatarchaeota archaeon]